MTDFLGGSGRTGNGKDGGVGCWKGPGLFFDSVLSVMDWGKLIGIWMLLMMFELGRFGA